jgi:hypothetical protein
VLVAGASLASCSSSSEKGGGSAEGGSADVLAADASLADASEEGADASIDVVFLPDVFIPPGPDGCSLTGASCLDDTACCSTLCVDGGCTRLPVQQ